MTNADLRAIAEKAEVERWTGPSVGGITFDGGDPAKDIPTIAHIKAWHPARAIAALDVIAAAQALLDDFGQDDPQGLMDKRLEAALARWQALEAK